MEDKQKNTITIWRILTYFIIYSIIGFFLETLFGLFTKGTLESRKGFLYGPFCPIYGLGAVLMIVSLQGFKKNYYRLFFGGFVVGSIVEYLISWLGELFFKVNWWDYSDKFLNINGRICFMFSLFWGLLAIYLMGHFNPIIDKFIDELRKKMPKQSLKAIVVVLTVFLLIDGIMTIIGLKIFFARTVYINNLDVIDKEKYIYEYEKYNKFNKIGDKIFSNKKMLRTFPNLKLKTSNEDIIYLDSIYKDIQSYYYKFNF